MPDKRKKYYIMLDTETCPLDKDFEGVTPFNMFVYDLGFAVVDKRGNVYESYSFVVKDIFFAEAELMKSAYYANKIPRVGTLYKMPWHKTSIVVRAGVRSEKSHVPRFFASGHYIISKLPVRQT